MRTQVFRAILEQRCVLESERGSACVTRETWRQRGLVGVRLAGPPAPLQYGGRTEYCTPAPIGAPEGNQATPSDRCVTTDKRSRRSRGLDTPPGRKYHIRLYTARSQLSSYSRASRSRQSLRHTCIFSAGTRSTHTDSRFPRAPLSLSLSLSHAHTHSHLVFWFFYALPLVCS